MKRFILALALLAAPLPALAECYTGHSEAAVSCAQGTTWDAEARACVPVTG